METIANYVAGELVSAASGRTLDNFEPATGAVYSKVPASDETDVAAAIIAAERAFPAWSGLLASERGGFLRRVAERIRAELVPLAEAESQDNGKPVALARALDIPRAAQNFEFFADAATQFASECHADGSYLNYTLRAPLGVVGCISPWNLPLYLFTWKIAPALAAGNCVVAKPSELTPMSAFRLAQLCREVGLPAGVLNIVHGLGPEVGGPLCASPQVSAISFTGSTRTGAEIAKTAGPSFKKTSLEMGGKNATVVFADCAFEETVEQVARSAFLNQGQICLCGSRIFVERALYPRFREALVARVRRLRVGDPREEGTDQGALVSQQHFDKVMGYLAIAARDGGQMLTGGRAAQVAGRCARGWFVEPTLIEGLSPESQANQDEIFGPVATLMPFDHEAEVLGWANGTRYGLAASLWTSDLSRAHRFSGGLRTGIVWVNCWMVRDLRTPFGGTKESGVGREGGFEALRFFTEPKNVCVKIGAAS